MKRTIRWLGFAGAALAAGTLLALADPSEAGATSLLDTDGQAYLTDFNAGQITGDTYQDGDGANVWKFAGDTAHASLQDGQLQLGSASSSTIGVFGDGFASAPVATFANFEASFDVTLTGFTQGGNVGLQFGKKIWSNGWGEHQKVYFDTSGYMAFLNGTTRLTDRHAIASYGGPAIAPSSFPWPSYRLKVVVADGTVQAYVDDSTTPVVEYNNLNALTGYQTSGFVGLFTFPNITTRIDNFLLNVVPDASERPTFAASVSGGSLEVGVPETPDRIAGFNVRYRNLSGTSVADSVYRYTGTGGETVSIPIDDDSVYLVKLAPFYTSDRTGVETELTMYKDRYVMNGAPAALLTADDSFSFTDSSAEIGLSVIGADTIRYTLDGSEPTLTNGTAITGDVAFGTYISIVDTTTLKAAAFVAGTKTASLMRTYTALPNEVELEDPAPYHDGFYHESKSIRIRSVNADGLIYTLDGTAPAYNAATGLATNGTLAAQEEADVVLPESSVTLKAIAVRSGNASVAVSQAFTYLPPGTQAELYVDPANGDDANAGSLAEPLKTIEAARDAVRALNDAMTGDIVVFLRGGTYSLDDTLAFGTEDSGTRSFRVVYRAYPGEKPVLSGGTVVAGWTLYDSVNGIYRAPSGSIDTRQLYVNGERAVRARSDLGLPDGTADSAGHTTTWTDMAGWANPDDIEFVYKERWTAPRFSVDQITASGSTATIVMDQPGWAYGLAKGSTAPTVPWYIENAYELLDSPGEWYLDKSAGYFYYKPRAGENMATVSVVAPTLTELVTIEGDSIDEPVHDMAFEGLTFADAGWLRPSTDSGHADIQANYIREPALPGNAYPQEFIADAAVVVRTGRQIDFERDDFTRLGATGLNILEGSQDMYIRGSRFYDISGSAIQIGEVDMNDPNNRYPSDPKYLLRNISVDNNYIHDIAVEYRSGVGVSAAYPVGLTIARNEFARLPYSAVHIGWGWSNFPANATRDNEIAYNKIRDVMQVLHDGGAIYAVGSSYGTGHESFIHDNDIRGVPNYHGAIYLDQGTSDWRVNDNVVRQSQKLFVTNGGNANISGTGNFSDTLGIAAPEGILTGTTFVTDGEWPQAALDIIADSGITSVYSDILPASPPPEEEADGELVDDDFESYTPGGNPLNWDKVETGGTVRVAPTGSGQALELNSGGSGSGAVVAYRIFRNTHGKLSIELDLKTSATSGFRLAPYLLNARSEPVITLGIMNGYLVNNRGSVQDQLASLAADTWYHLRIEADTDTDTFDLYLNGVKLLDQASFRTASAEIEQIRFGNDVSVSGSMQIDNVIIGNGIISNGMIEETE
ncbi:chitobiase/beta-hexosaminidase C-terminal domain-containing protein [Cohnella fermenti]|nr:chitobiase/beta-hexosaminidase C-terminal domain-containing protein [Cohnella fermenti]